MTMEEIEKINDSNRKWLEDCFSEYGGQLVLIDSLDCKVQRFVAIADNEYDYIYVTYDTYPWQICYHTILDRLIPLKGFLREEDYNVLNKNYFRIPDVTIDMIKNTINCNLSKKIRLLSEIKIEI